MHPTVERKNEVLQTYRIPAAPDPEYPTAPAATWLSDRDVKRRELLALRARQVAAGALFLLLIVVFFLPGIGR